MKRGMVSQELSLFAAAPAVSKYTYAEAVGKLVFYMLN